MPTKKNLPIYEYETKKGTRYRVVFSLPPDPVTGERRQTTKRGFKTEGAARRFLSKMETEVDEGTWVEPTKATLASYLHQWLDGLHLKATTVADY